MLAQQQRPPIPLLFLKELRQLFPQCLLQGGHGLMPTLCRGSAPVLLRVQSRRRVLGEDNASGVCKGTKRKAALRQFFCFPPNWGLLIPSGDACVCNALQTAPKSWHRLPLGTSVCFDKTAFKDSSLSLNISSKTSWVVSSLPNCLGNVAS